jgi:hypothetical protein
MNTNLIASIVEAIKIPTIAEQGGDNILPDSRNDRRSYLRPTWYADRNRKSKICLLGAKQIYLRAFSVSDGTGDRDRSRQRSKKRLWRLLRTLRRYVPRLDPGLLQERRILRGPPYKGRPGSPGKGSSYSGGDRET